MNAPAPPAAPAPPTETKTEEKAILNLPGIKAVLVGTWWGPISVMFYIVFSTGAAYLSYQRNQSAALAILAFFFAFIYYPWHAFSSGMMGSAASAPIVTPTETLMTAGRRIAKLLGRKKH